ncbi:hypothetical protein [Nocardia crassostreae]|uniref:hypothetical protein n=1 Tax=Nocardia crassostreae TaxID=53428 RepID=UPI00082F1CBF|nr:hypothetical protein [Nocardia crassostreae]
MSQSEPHLYLSHDEIRDLSTLLREIPSLAEDLEDTVAGRARLGDPNLRLNTRTSDQPLPFSPSAAKIRDHLHTVLVGWVRLICEQRAIAYPGHPSTGALARWLNRNLIALAMTEGVESAPAELRAAVEAAEAIVCPPPERIAVNPNAIEAARRALLNASGIATLAQRLGEPFRAVTVRRIQTLRDAGKVSPVPGPWAVDWPEQFLVGEVLDAHLAHPVRAKRTSSAQCGGHPARPRVERESVGRPK